METCLFYPVAYALLGLSPTGDVCALAFNCLFVFSMYLSFSHSAHIPLSGSGMHSQSQYADAQGPRTTSSSNLAYPLSTHIQSMHTFTTVQLTAYNQA